MEEVFIQVGKDEDEEIQKKYVLQPIAPELSLLLLFLGFREREQILKSRQAISLKLLKK